MELRPGAPADLPLVYRLERLYIEDLEHEQLAAWLDNLGRHLDQWVAALPRMIVAHVRGVAAGYLFWERQADTALLASVAVEPAHRRRGIASTLLGRFEEDARLAGCAAVELGFVSHNPARHLYENFGYRPAGTRGRYVLMTKDL